MAKLFIGYFHCPSLPPALRRAVTVFLVSLSFLEVGGGQSRRNHGHNLEAEVTSYLQPYLEIGGFNGSILIAKGDTILMVNGYGMANVELSVPNTPKTKFHIASLSKTFTAAAIMMLQEEGNLSVNDPLSRFIPAYPEVTTITIHHLLTHTSGIPDVNNLPGYEEKSRFPQTTAQLVELFNRAPLESRPGERYAYSNSNYNLLALIIEQVSGMSYGAFLKERIFDRLGLVETGHDESPRTILLHRASGYVPSGESELENAPFIDWTIKTGNGSLYSTVGDLYRWSRGIFEGDILSKSSKVSLFTPHVNNSVGYGWFISKRLNRRVIRMSGRSPGFAAEMQHYPGDSLFVVILANNYAPTAGLIATDLAAIVLGERYERPRITRAVKVETKVLDQHVGRYDGKNNFFRPGTMFEIERRGTHLFMKWSTGAEVRLTPQPRGHFFDRTFWAFVRFEGEPGKPSSKLIWSFSGEDYEAGRVGD